MIHTSGEIVEQRVYRCNQAVPGEAKHIRFSSRGRPGITVLDALNHDYKFLEDRDASVFADGSWGSSISVRFEVRNCLHMNSHQSGLSNVPVLVIGLRFLVSPGKYIVNSLNLL